MTKVWTSRFDLPYFVHHLIMHWEILVFVVPLVKRKQADSAPSSLRCAI